MSPSYHWVMVQNLFENQLLDLTMFPFFLLDALVVLGGSGEQLKIFL